MIVDVLVHDMTTSNGNYYPGSVVTYAVNSYRFRRSWKYGYSRVLRVEKSFCPWRRDRLKPVSYVMRERPAERMKQTKLRSRSACRNKTYFERNQLCQ